MDGKEKKSKKTISDFHCNICDKTLRGTSKDKHNNSQKHRLNEINEQKSNEVSATYLRHGR